MDNPSVCREEVYSDVLWTIFMNDDDLTAKKLAKEVVEEAVAIGWEGQTLESKERRNLEHTVACLIGDTAQLRDDAELAPIAEQIIKTLEEQFGSLPKTRGRKPLALVAEGDTVK